MIKMTCDPFAHKSHVFQSKMSGLTGKIVCKCHSCSTVYKCQDDKKAHLIFYCGTNQHFKSVAARHVSLAVSWAGSTSTNK